MSSKQTGMKASTAPLAVPEVRIRDEGRHRFSAERAGWQPDRMHASIDNNDRFSPVASKDKRKSRPVISTDPEDEKACIQGACGPRSPLAWICDLNQPTAAPAKYTQEKRGVSGLSTESVVSGNSLVSSYGSARNAGERKTSSQNYDWTDESRPPSRQQQDYQNGRTANHIDLQKDGAAKARYSSEFSQHRKQPAQQGLSREVHASSDGRRHSSRNLIAVESLDASMSVSHSLSRTAAAAQQFLSNDEDDYSVSRSELTSILPEDVTIKGRSTQESNGMQIHHRSSSTPEVHPLSPSRNNKGSSTVGFSRTQQQTQPGTLLSTYLGIKSTDYTLSHQKPNHFPLAGVDEVESLVSSYAQQRPNHPPPHQQLNDEAHPRYAHHPLATSSTNPSVPEITTSSALNTPLRPLTGDSRIVAPNVSKLSPHSAVEVRLMSSSDMVVVLCSVDVLKMRSGFFHDVLTNQENNNATTSVGQQRTPTNSMVIDNGNPSGGNVLWRDPIVIPEHNPYEAAAFLESLHEGRALFRGEWNYCWARLSVAWIVEDLVSEYASQIEEHMNKVTTCIQAHHWRTNPAVLAGMRVAVFRKGSNPMPTVVNGMILEAPNIGYSKVRVAFDAAERTPIKSLLSHEGSFVSTPSHYPMAAKGSEATMSLSPSAVLGQQHQASQPQYQQQRNSSILHHTSEGNVRVAGTAVAASTANVISPRSSTDANTRGGAGSHLQQIVGDVTEPFWVQALKEGAIWTDPDDLFVQVEAKRLLTTTDKRVFWEMAKALIELPEISRACRRGSIRNEEELTLALKKPEYRVLWTIDGPDILPKTAASELIRAAYVDGVATVVGNSTTGNSGGERM